MDAGGRGQHLIERDRHGVTVADMTRLCGDAAVEGDLLVRAAQVPALPDGWKARVRTRLDRLAAR
ncbi:MAG TPA: hypothetical protein VGX75_00560 [bacterium]|nr:hypothetical protein [bacterium]